MITKLRARGARVFFVAPIPAGVISNPDPVVWNPIWRGYLPVLKQMHVPIIDTAAKLRGPDGLRVETKPGCTGAQERVRPPGRSAPCSVRRGPGRYRPREVRRTSGRPSASTGTARPAIAPPRSYRHATDAATGSSAATAPCTTSVPPRTCRARAPRSPDTGGVVAAAVTRDGKGLWLVAADGTIASVGDAARMKFRTKAASAITSASVTPDGKGLFATTNKGVVLTAGTASGRGSLSSRRINGAIVDIEITRDGKGYWLAGSDGAIFSFGNARFHGSIGGAKVAGRIVGMAATPDNKGYWQVGADGGIFAFGDARYQGNARWATPRYPLNLFTVAPGPAVDVVAAPTSRQGYWVVGDTGRVTNSGAAIGHAGTNSMALFSQ